MNWNMQTNVETNFQDEKPYNDGTLNLPSQSTEFSGKTPNQLMTENIQLQIEISQLKKALAEIQRSNEEKDTVIDDLADKYQQALDASLVDEFGFLNAVYYKRFKEREFKKEYDHNKIGIIFCDINGLKLMNDLSGSHSAGDKLITRMYEYLAASFNEDDTIIHLSGDEFMVICRNHSGIENFEEILTARINEVREAGLQMEDPISFASGVAVFDSELDLNGLDDTKDRADARMYVCKEGMKADNGEITSTTSATGSDTPY